LELVVERPPALHKEDGMTKVVFDSTTNLYEAIVGGKLIGVYGTEEQAKGAILKAKKR
jgi:hypothetical protein